MQNASLATILFVDDDQRIVNLLRLMFRSHYNVLTATSGIEALDLLIRYRVDVLVSDQRMPGMTGIDLLRRAREIAPGAIRILLTGYSDLSAIVGSVNEGEVFRFLNKPWDNENIRQTLTDAVTAAHASQSQAVHAPPAGTPIPGTWPDVLLVDDNPRDLLAMSEVLATQHHTRAVTSIKDALSALEQHDIGVIVTETHVNNDNMIGFLRAVKQLHPIITTVMLTSSADADQVVSLINRAQIFRFATKPMRRNVFQLAVQGAMKEHLRLKANPHLTARLRVERAHGDEDAAPIVSAVARSLARLKSLFGLSK